MRVLFYPSELQLVKTLFLSLHDISGSTLCNQSLAFMVEWGSWRFKLSFSAATTGLGKCYVMVSSAVTAWHKAANSASVDRSLIWMAILD
jgi:hypothetical protein